MTDLTDTTGPDTGRPLTGTKVFAMIAGMFAVIITVNVIMAVSAVRTFPGLEVKSSHVAGQTFNDERAAQIALGWEVSAELTGGAIVIAVTDATGAAVEPARFSAILGRTTHAGADQTLVLTRAPDGSWQAPVALAPGVWQLRLDATAQDGTLFRHRLELHRIAG